VHIQTAKEKGLKIVSFDRHLYDARSESWTYKKIGRKVNRLYLDASAFIPLVKWEGKRTAKMQHLLFKDNTALYISNFTLSEVYNVLNR